MSEMDISLVLFTIDQGNIKVLLLHRDEEPYRGYWMLPTISLTKDQTIEELVDSQLHTLGLKGLPTKQVGVFSDIARVPRVRTIGLAVMSWIDIKSFELKETVKEEHNWFHLELLPKIIYDQQAMIEQSKELFVNVLLHSNELLTLFPSDFTLPELQMTYEELLGSSLDRRNFRKKLMQFHLLKDTGYKNEGASGRPAKLYSFQENADLTSLF